MTTLAKRNIWYRALGVRWEYAMSILPNMDILPLPTINL